MLTMFAIPYRVAVEEIVELDQSRETEPHLRSSQKRLAEVLTQIVHRQDGLDAARKATDIFFGSEIQDLSDEQLLDIFADVPSWKSHEMF